MSSPYDAIFLLSAVQVPFLWHQLTLKVTMHKIDKGFKANEFCCCLKVSIRLIRDLRRMSVAAAFQGKLFLIFPTGYTDKQGGSRKIDFGGAGTK